MQEESKNKNIKKDPKKTKSVTRLKWNQLDNKTRDAVDYFLNEMNKDEYDEKLKFATSIREIINKTILSRDVAIGLLQIELFNLQLNTVNWSSIKDALNEPIK